MDSTWDDVKKLNDILQTNNSDSDTSSIDSLELDIDCKMFDVVQITNDDIIRNCKDQTLQQALITNVKKRNVLRQIIKNLEQHLLKLKHVYKEQRTKLVNQNNSKKTRRSIMIKRLGVPYFKDQNAFPSPVNADWLEMRNNKLIFQYSVTPNIWTQEDKYNLTVGVYTEICNYRLEEITKEINALKKEDSSSIILNSLQMQRQIFSNNELLLSLLKKWQSLSTIQETNQKDTDELTIIKTVSEWQGRIDWLQISAHYLETRHSDIECQAMWNCYMSPKYSKESWKNTENKSLAELCEKYNYQNWEAIALELNTQRSAYQCCVHFHAKLCEKFNRDKWTPEEDMYLQSVIDSCSVGNYISWGKVAYYFKHRTKMQIYRHYTSCIAKQFKKGSFSVEEDILLLTLMNVYNQNTRLIKTYFPNRVLEQLRNRIKTLNSDTTTPWTPQEDAKIIAFVAKNGQKNWNLLTQEITRSSGCIRHRFRTIRKFYEMNPGSSVLDIPRRTGGTFRTLIRNRHKLVRQVVSFLLKKLNVCEKKSDLLNLDYIREIIKPFQNNEEKQIKVKEKVSEPEINIHQLISDFFKTSFKTFLRLPYKLTDNYINHSADRVQIVLSTLGANINFPSLDTIKAHPMLDDYDKLIIQNIINRKNQTNNVHLDINKLTKCIPPSIESLIGFRGVLLHLHVLKAHSRGIYDGYNLYVKSEPHFTYVQHGYNYNKHKLENMLLNNKDDTKTNELAILDRQLFFKRLKLLFQLTFVIADTKVEPICEINEPIPEPPKIQLKPGRKKNAVKNYKIALMNEARKNSAAEKRKIRETKTENCSKKIKLDQ